MLILPVARQPDWRNPPLATLFLILLNVLIFFGAQAEDGRKEEEAMRYYFQSDLGRIELPRYVRDLEARGKKPPATVIGKKEQVDLFEAMQYDPDFMQRLHDGLIIKADEADHALWRRQRAEFERLWRRSVTERFGFKTAAPSFSSLIGHMFLHGSVGHLFGNMAVLFVVGYLVEEALGKRRYLAFYLLAGLSGGLCDFLFNAPRLAAGIGASGAVSGVMAMFVTLYGMRRIRFFYWLLIYFDFFRAPAILVLYVWIANELYKFLFNTGSHVNYMAHLGGFIGGALLVFLWRKRGKPGRTMPRTEAPSDPLPGELARIDTLLGKLRIEEASTALRRLAKSHPHDLAVLGRYYQVSRHAPASDDYHRAAALIFGLTETHPAAATLICETWSEYLKLARPSVRLGTRTMVALIESLTRSGHASDAERLLGALSRRAPQEVPRLMLRLAHACRQNGDTERAQALLHRLQEEHPGSEAAR